MRQDSAADSISNSSEQLQDDINPQKRLNALGDVHRRNLRRYRSGTYDGGVKLVVNAEWFQRDHTLGWAKIARGGVESYAAPGDHFTFRNAGEHAAEVARQITKWITAAREGDEDGGPNVDKQTLVESELPLFWTELLINAKADLADIIPAGDRYILVDEAQWGDNFLKDRFAIPFLECDGQYAGCPPDDETAIRELQRLRNAGANFIVFGWPAFWWLNHYEGLREFLRKKSDCILRNDCLVAFDLRADTSARDVVYSGLPSSAKAV